MRQLVRLKFKNIEGLDNRFIAAEELLIRLVHAGEVLSEPLFNAMNLNGFREPFEHFMVQECFKPAGSFAELRMQLFNHQDEQFQRKGSDDSHIVMG